MSTLRDKLAWTLKRDVIREIKTAIKDEEAAVIMYNTLAERLETLGERQFAVKARLIATDERTHASELRRILDVMKR